LHWFNPLEWLAAALSRRDAELACDEGTIRRIGEKNRLEYGRTLIQLICAKRKPMDLLCCATTMSQSKKEIRERIALIAKKPKMFLITMVIVILAAAAGCTFTGSKLNKSSDSTDDAEYKTPIEGKEELFKKLDEFLENPNVTGEELTEARNLLGIETVTVETAQEFLDSIRPHRIIRLNPGTYRLDELPDDYTRK
jgi:hypothetical protein